MTDPQPPEPPADRPVFVAGEQHWVARASAPAPTAAGQPWLPPPQPVIPRPPRDPDAFHRADRVASIVLLSVGAFATVGAGVVPLIVRAATAANLGADYFDSAEAASRFGVMFWTHVTLLAFATVVTALLLRARKPAFWVAIVAGLIAALVFWIAIAQYALSEHSIGLLA